MGGSLRVINERHRHVIAYCCRKCDLLLEWYFHYHRCGPDTSGEFTEKNCKRAVLEYATRRDTLEITHIQQSWLFPPSALHFEQIVVLAIIPRFGRLSMAEWRLSLSEAEAWRSRDVFTPL
jgi:hypothetical protein